MRMIRAVLIAAALTAVASPQIAAQSAGTYVDLGTLGGTRTTPIAINDLGEVVGLSSLAGDLVQRPFLWVDGTMNELDLLPGHTSGQARGLNNRQQVVGMSIPPGFLGFFDSRAVLWENGSVIDLNTAATAGAGVVLAAAFGINDAGQIVGYGFKPGIVQFAFLWDRGVVTELGTLGGANSAAASINSFGQIAGLAATSGGVSHAVTWTNGVIKDLGGGGGGSAGFNVANGLNDFGEAAGSWVTAGGVIPMFWDAAGAPMSLPLLGSDGNAFDINNIRQIAGTSAGAAVVWQEGSAVDLDSVASVPGSLAAATAINNIGQVVGWTDGLRGFLVQLPVPAAGVAAAIGSLVSDAGTQASLLAKINGAAGTPTAECNALRAAANEIEAQSGKKIPTNTAAQLLEAIDRARADCQ